MKPALRLVHDNPRPVIKGSLRPFRLWNARTATFLPHRYFAMSLTTHRAAHWETNFVRVGVTLEVLNVETGACLGQYTKTPTGTRVWWAPREQMSWKALR